MAIGRRSRRPWERWIHALLVGASLISILTTLGIVLSLVFEAYGFFREVSVVEFLTGTQWTPLFRPQHFGVLPLLAGTFMVAIGALVVALPLGLGSALYLSEYAPDRVRRMLKPILEVLAGIPTVVYGYFALTYVTPNIIRPLFPQADIFNAASAAIVVGIMVTPMIASLSEDAMTAVPQSLRAAGYALGATRLEVAIRVVLPAALSGVVASIILAVSRAIGETMIVALAAGSTPNLTWDPLESIQTMTGYIVQVSLGDTPHGSIEYMTLFAVGLTLFVITLLMNILAQYVSRRFRRVAE